LTEQTNSAAAKSRRTRIGHNIWASNFFPVDELGTLL
jgi:hypothetical protein